MNSSKCLPCLILVFAILGNVGAVSAQQAAVPAHKSLPDQIREYTADHRSVANFYHLPASDLAFDQRQQLETGWQEKLKTVAFDLLGLSGKVDYLLLANHLQQSLDSIARQRKRVAEMDRLIPFRKLITTLEAARWRAVSMDYPGTASRLEEMARQVKTLREEFQKTHKSKASTNKKPKDSAGSTDIKISDGNLPPDVSPGLALRASTTTRELLETLKRWFNFTNGYQPEFDWWMKQPYEKAAKELDEYARFLREDIAGQKGKDDDPFVGDPIGAEAVAADIRFEMLPYSAQELVAIGERELAWGQKQMEAAARDMGLGEDWKAALARVKGDHVPPGGQPALIEKIGREATEFVKQKKLVTVPPLAEETWRLTMIAPEGIKTMPYAAYGGQQILIAYAKDTMSQEDKLMIMRGNNRHFMRLVTPHELIPGHHLQAFYAARHNNYRELFSTPFYFEGWALYWELRLWDLGWGKTPEDRIGMLFWRMTRAARIIVSLKYQLGQMKPDEMVDFFMTRVGHEKLGATSEVRRFISAPPLYQVGYLVGGLQLYALHKELVGGGKMTEQEFHDAVLTQGTMPIEMVRATLANLPLRRDTKPGWRFTGGRP